MAATVIRVARYELRRQLRSHVFWVVFAISAVMVLGSLWVDELRVGLPAEGLRNGAAAIVRTHFVWSLFFLFATAAFAADAALRDEIAGFASIVAATPTPGAHLRLGRTLGAAATSIACFASVPSALAAGSLAPWLAPESIGAFRAAAYAFAVAVVALPNLLLSSALFYALASATRSLAAGMLGAVGLLVLYGLGNEGGELPALLEPFGILAYNQAVEGWSGAMREAFVPPVAGPLLANRLLWLGLTGLAVAAAVRIPPRAAPVVARAAVTEPQQSPAQATIPTRRFAKGAAIAQFAARTRLEVRQVIASPIFLVLMLLGLCNAAAALWAASDPATGGAATPRMIEALARAFRLLPTVVALFFAGELIWNERERGIHALVGATPIPDAAYLLPKLLAVVTVLASLAATSTAAALVVQVARGTPAEPGLYLLEWMLPAAYDWMLVAVLAVFFQAVAPAKVAGWGLMVLYLIASLALQRLGYDDPIYRYGRYPGWPSPAGAEGAGLYRTYWGAAAIVLAVIAFALVGRGAEDGVAARIRRLPARLRGTAGLAFALGALAWSAALGFVLASRA